MIYLLHGENYFESLEESRKLRDELSSKNDLEIILMEDEDIKVNPPEIGGYNLFSKPYLYVLKRFFNIDKNLQEKLFVDFQNSQENIIIWHDRKVDARSKIFKGIKKKGVVREFQNLKGAELNRWIKQRADELDMALDNEKINLLRFRFDNNQAIINNELGKLSSFVKVQDRKKVEKEDLDILSSYYSINVWDFIEDIFTKKKIAALEFIDNLMMDNGEEFIILGSIVSQLRTLYCLKKFGSGISSELTGKLKIHPFTIKKSMNYINNFTLERIEKLYEQVVKLDYSIKRSEIEPKLGLSLLVVSL